MFERSDSAPIGQPSSLSNIPTSSNDRNQLSGSCFEGVSVDSRYASKQLKSHLSWDGMLNFTPVWLCFADLSCQHWLVGVPMVFSLSPPWSVCLKLQIEIFLVFSIILSTPSFVVAYFGPNCLHWDKGNVFNQSSFKAELPPPGRVEITCMAHFRGSMRSWQRFWLTLS